MATATSLTAETIESLMSGWEGVSEVQQSQAALLTTFEGVLASHQANLTEWNEITLPQLEADLAESSIAVSNLLDTHIPNLQAQLDVHDLNLTDLNTVTLPSLQTQLSSNSDWILELNDITLPAWEARLIETEAAVATIDLGPLNAEVDALQAKFPITGPDISANAIEANHIASHTITALQIAGDTITANEIAAGTITALELAAGTITATEIAGRTITALQLAAGTITANEIAADTITANEIAADTITANEIAADTITANEIAADTITANEIATGTITALEIAGETITGDKIAANTIAVTKMIIGDLTNYVADGDIQDPTLSNWNTSGGASTLTRVDPVGARPYLQATTGNAHLFFHNRHLFELENQDEFLVTFEISAPATNTADFEFRPAIEIYDVDGASLLWQMGEGLLIPSDTPWTKFESVVRISHGGAIRGRFNSLVPPTTGSVQTVRLRNISMRKRGSGSLFVDGTITSQQIGVNAITAENIDVGTLTGDLFAGTVILGSIIRAGDLSEEGLIQGGYAEMGVNGIFTVDTDGNPVASLPLDSGTGAYLKAHIDLLSADVRDNFTMHGTNNSIATESELTLSAGVEAPSVPPALQQVWDTLQLNTTQAVPPHSPSTGYNLGTFAFVPSQVTSIDWDSTWNNWIVCQQKSNGFRIWRFNTSGAIALNLSTGRPWVDDYNDRINATLCYNSVRDMTSMLFKAGAIWYIWGATQGGTSVINKVPDTWIVDIATRPPKLSFDPGTNTYKIVQNNGGGSGTIFVRTVTLNTGSNFPNATSTGTNNFEAGSGMAKRINGAVLGPQLRGSGTDWVINVDDYLTAYAFTGSGVALNDDGSYWNWLKPGPALGLCHNGTQYASIDSAGKITFYESWTWNSLQSKVYIGASAFDSDTAGDQANPHVGQLAGQHETPVGTMVAVTLNRRSKLRITMPETNDSGGADDPDKWKLYFYRGDSAPTNASWLKYIDMIGSPTASTSKIITADAIGGAPPGGIKGQVSALNNFPGADPARLESAKDDLLGPLIQLRGDGAGRVGPFQWTSNGRPLAFGSWAAGSAQSINSATWTVRTGWASRHATMAPTTAISYSNGNFTVQKAGLWFLAASITFNGVAQAAGRRIMAIYVDDVEVYRGEQQAGTASNIEPTSSAAGVVYLPAGAVIQVRCWQNSGAALATLTSASTNNFSAMCLAAY